jgi:CheY-like chemotaxis protein
MPESRTVLVADDDENDFIILRRAFQKAGLTHRLIHVQDGEAAIDYLSGNAPYVDRVLYPAPNLLLLDLKMPRVNGFDVLAWLQSRKDLDALNVIVLSASQLEADKNQAAQLGADDYRTKPHDFDELVQMARELDERWTSQLHRAATGETPSLNPSL